MLNYGRAHVLDAPHLTVFPGLAIAIVVLGLNLLGDSLRDRFGRAEPGRVTETQKPTSSPSDERGVSGFRFSAPRPGVRVVAQRIARVRESDRLDRELFGGAAQHAFRRCAVFPIRSSARPYMRQCFARRVRLVGDGSECLDRFAQGHAIVLALGGLQPHATKRGVDDRRIGMTFGRTSERQDCRILSAKTRVCQSDADEPFGSCRLERRQRLELFDGLTLPARSRCRA